MADYNRDRRRSSDDVRWLETRIENVVNLKASKEFVASELARIRDQIYAVRDKMEEVDDRIGNVHQCNQTGVFSTLSARLDSIKSDIDVNAAAIKKLYIWQASVGISLLVFFLTIGVAALRYVDQINFAVQQNQTELHRMEEKNKDRRNKAVTRGELKEILQETLQSKITYQ